MQDALEAVGLNYQVEDSGTYQVVAGVRDERTQLALISSNTTMLGSMEIREISSPAHIETGSLSAETANRLLQENASKKLGAWEILESDGRTVVVFTAKIDADSSPEDLQAALSAVMYTADDIERELNGGDQF